MKGARFWIGIAAIICFAAAVWNYELYAEKLTRPNEVYEEIRARYFKLRNTDLQFSKTSQWKVVLSDFEKFARDFPHSELSAKALFHSATINEQHFRQNGDQFFLQESLRLYRLTSSSYPRSDTADDALIREGDIYLYDQGNLSDAEKVYRLVASQYSQSDMWEVAKERLRTIESGEYESLHGGAAMEQNEKLAAADEFIVVLDPGHGGEDTGAIGRGGLLEKDVTLAVALEVERLIKKADLAKVRLTRRTDVFVPLAQRTHIANSSENGIFISLHTNASASGKLTGLQTFYLDTAGDEASRLLAERENAAGDGEVSDLDFMLSDLVQTGKMRDSLRLTNTLHRAILNHVRIRWDGVVDAGVKKAPFFVLVGAHMPCVLVELFFIDHAVDGVRLGQKEFRSDVAHGLFLGIRNFIEALG